jgi:hypothetical protein
LIDNSEIPADNPTVPMMHIRRLFSAPALIAALATACGSPNGPGDVVNAADSAPMGDGASVDVPSSMDGSIADGGPMDDRQPIDVVPVTDTARADAPARDVVLMSTPSAVFCFGAGSCTGGPTPVCCDSHVDGGFTDTCVATPAACRGDAFECDDGTDCFDGVCCATTGFNASGGLILLGSRCTTLPETGCRTPERQVCADPGQCSGNPCVPMHASGRDIGLCN